MFQYFAVALPWEWTSPLGVDLSHGMKFPPLLLPPSEYKSFKSPATDIEKKMQKLGEKDTNLYFGYNITINAQYGHLLPLYKV